MKRLWIFFILIVLAGGTGKALSSNNEAAKDSLLQILDTLPADSSRLEMLYSLAYLDPMSPSCVYYLGKLLEEATTQDNKYYQCLALYAHVVYYFNHQDEENTVIWMDKLSPGCFKKQLLQLILRRKKSRNNHTYHKA